MEVETPIAPHGQHAARVAAAHEDRVLLEHERFEVAWSAREKRQMRGRAVELAEARIEAQASDFSIAGRGADVEHLGSAALRLLEKVFDEAKVVELRRERHAADGENLSCACHGLVS